MTFEQSAYVLSGFMAFFGVLFLYLSMKSPAPSKNSLRAVLQGRVGFLLFGLLYLSLSHFSLYSGVAYSIEYANDPVCEYQVANATVTGNLTVYDYLNPCIDRVVPTATERLLTVFSWMLFIDVLALVLGAMILFGAVMQEW